MKKLFLIAAMTVAVLSASAQSRFDPGTLTLQPRFGFTGSMLTNMPDLDVSVGHNLDATATGGGFTGLDLEYQLTERISLATGANWAQAGSGWKDTNINGVKAKDIKVETSYINVPVVVNLYVAKGFALKTGVQCGFLTSAKMKMTFETSAGGINSKTDIDQSCKDEFKKFDLSIPVGLSYEFKKPFVIDARYHIGLTKVNKESISGGKDSKNLMFSLTFGYKFKL